MKKKIAILSFVLITSSLLIGIGCYLIYQKGEKANSSMICVLLSNVLDYDVDKRLKDSGVPYSFSNMQPGESIKPDIITIQTEDSVSYIEKTAEHEVKTIAERNDLALQSLLLISGHPLNVHTIDSLLTAELHKEKIQADLGVRYISKQAKEVQDSKPGDPVYNAFSTDFIPLGFGGEMKVQAFYKISFSSIVRQELALFIALIFFWLFIVLLSFFLFFRKPVQEPVQKIAYIPLSDIETTPDHNPLIQVDKTIFYDPAKAITHYNTNQTLSLTEQQATFFLALLRAPKRYLTNKEIEDLLWKKQKNKRGTRLQAINRLREALEPIPELQIKSINKGYQLQITKK